MNNKSINSMDKSIKYNISREILRLQYQFVGIKYNIRYRLNENQKNIKYCISKK